MERGSTAQEIGRRGHVTDEQLTPDGLLDRVHVSHRLEVTPQIEELELRAELRRDDRWIVGECCVECELAQGW
jgi:hypothetical protein